MDILRNTGNKIDSSKRGRSTNYKFGKSEICKTRSKNYKLTGNCAESSTANVCVWKLTCKLLEIATSWECPIVHSCEIAKSKKRLNSVD